MKKTKILGTALIGALLFSGCAQIAYTDGKASQIKKGDALTLGLDRQDFESAAETMINSMLRILLLQILNQVQERLLLLVGL